jgi:hypothetical protein
MTMYKGTMAPPADAGLCSGSAAACPPWPPCPPARPQVVLACGNGTGVVLPDHGEQQSQLYNPYVVASVSLDTTGLARPTVKVDFSSIITYKESSYWPSDLRLTFQLSKVCNGAKIALGTWNFERFLKAKLGCMAGDLQAEANGSCGMSLKTELVDSFGFTFCECDACPGCCVYSVELINVESNNVDFAAVTQAQINALAVGQGMPWG